MSVIAETLNSPQILDQSYHLKAQRDLVLAHIDDARARYLSRELFSRLPVHDLAIDPGNVKCPEDTIGADLVEDEPGAYVMRVSTAEIGAIYGIEEQVLTLQGLMAFIRHKQPDEPTSGFGFIRKHAGFVRGVPTPSLTVQATVTSAGISNVDIYRSLVTPEMYNWSPVSEIRRNQNFRRCLQAARYYRETVVCPRELPSLAHPPHRTKPSDVITVYSHFGNSFITSMMREAGLPALADVGIERTDERRRKHYKAMYDTTEDEARRGKHLVPCRSFAAWINQAIISSYLETGRPPLSNNDIRLIAIWINQASEISRQRSLEENREKACLKALQDQHAVAE